jgi:hypothetical protein
LRRLKCPMSLKYQWFMSCRKLCSNQEIENWGG